MLKSLRPVSVILVALALLLGGCQKAAPTPTEDPMAVITQAAQTAQAYLTQVSLLTPSATITPTPTQTNTPEPPTATFTATLATPLASATMTLPPISDSAQLLDQSPADGTVFSPGSDFTVVWRLKNSGVTSWTTSYRMRFYAGTQMAAVNSVNLSGAVGPNQEIQVSIPMRAPVTSGEYTSIWVLSNAQDGNFYNVFIRIVVSGSSVTATATVAPTSSTPVVTSTP